MALVEASWLLGFLDGLTQGVIAVHSARVLFAVRPASKYEESPWIDSEEVIPQRQYIPIQFNHNNFFKDYHTLLVHTPCPPRSIVHLIVSATMD